MKRVVVIVLDGFGIGAMSDVRQMRPEDEGAHTLRSILRDFPDAKWPTLERLGLMNAYGEESPRMKYSKKANFGRIELKHQGADTFMGHQEIMGTDPKAPYLQPIQEKVDAIADALQKAGHKVEIIQREGLRYLVCDDYVTIADNLEADPGMCYNVTAPLDLISFEDERKIGEVVRSVARVGRVIVFGGRGNRMEDLFRAEQVRDGKTIGIAAAPSKSYEKDYHCVHLGYGVDPRKQLPTILAEAGKSCILIGKVADIVHNEQGVSIPCVPTQECMAHTVEQFDRLSEGFLCTNVQETDLAGHAQSASRYRDVLSLADQGIGELLSRFQRGDLLMVMADHGNDPDIGHGKHTRERVPLLVYTPGVEGVNLGTRSTLSDVGATAAEALGVRAPENGRSFLFELIKKETPSVMG